MCGTAYNIEALKHINHFTGRTNFLVTDNCDCHDKHETLYGPTFG